ncbi:MAG: elongation factor G [Bacteroidales bacterium]|nr:elongation factor G [Bacteroidales bacterium]
MKVYNTGDIRNIALAGNAGSGKTTLAENIAFEGGKIQRRGTIDSKSTLSDYRLVEHEQAGSVYSSVLNSEWDSVKINILDAPGALDFIGSAVSSIAVADTTLLLLNTQNGVEVGSEIHWRLTEKFNKPVVIIANHLDHDKTNFEKTIDQAREKLSNHVAIIQYPVNQGAEFNSIIDLITGKMYKWNNDGTNPEVVDIPAEEADKAKELRMQLIETAAENDEALMETFFENETLTEDEMREGILKGILNRGMFPVLCTAAKNNMGTRRLLDFVKNALPAPDTMPATLTTDDKEIKFDAKGPKSLFFFKTSVEEHLGEVLYFKVMSGEINESDDMINSSTQNKERISQIFAVNGKNRDNLSKIVAGDIGATVKLKGTSNGDTLSEKGTDLKFKDIEYPNPKYRKAIKALSESDDEKLGEYLHRLHDEDPTYILEYSKELKQLIIHGQGDHHLNTLKWHLDNIFSVQTEFIAPKIPYRETITKAAQSDYRHKKQSGGAGQFGEVHMIIEPHVEGKAKPSAFKIGGKEYTVTVRDEDVIDLKWGGKLVFYNCIVGGVIDKNYMPAIIKGLMEKMENGPLTGSYARDIRVSVYDGKMHDVDSNEISFKIAGSKAFSDAFKQAGAKILEPIYNLEVMVPSESMGDVMSDLQGRRSIIQGMSSAKGFEVINAKVPLAEISKYATALSSISGGRATFEMEFDEYSPVPGDLQNDLIKAHEAEQEDDD